VGTSGATGAATTTTTLAAAGGPTGATTAEIPTGATTAVASTTSQPPPVPEVTASPPVPGLRIVKVLDVPSTGGTLHIGVGSWHLSFVVPPDDASEGTQLSLMTAPLGDVPPRFLVGHHDIALLGVALERNGQPLTGTLPAPVRLVLASRALGSGDTLFVLDPASHTFVPVSELSNLVSDASFGAGTASFDVDADPVVAIEAPDTSRATTSATERARAAALAERRRADELAALRHRAAAARRHAAAPRRPARRPERRRAAPAVSPGAVTAATGSASHSSGSTELAYTGITVGPLLVLGGLLLVGGSLLRRRARRRVARSA